jgi:crotonobetainyl-CoA:carnitine CoA-transferase CaiB-like acyl-CoA transferase
VGCFLLDNIFVLDLADGRAGFCSKLLADLGASVIKIEPPDGDPTRNDSLSFSYNNSNKRGIVLNLETPEGRQTLDALIRKTDILVETGQFENSGLDPRFPECINPSLIHISLPSQASYPASLYGTIAAILNLLKREISGEGCHADLSIQEIMPADDHKTVLFHILPCKDGFIQMTIMKDWETLLEIMASEQMASDLAEQKWLEESVRTELLQHIIDRVTEWTLRHTKNELFHFGQLMRFPWAPVENPAEVLNSPQLQARNFFIPTAVHGNSPVLPLPGAPYRFDSHASPYRKPAPLLGEDAPQVLNHLNIPAENRPEIIRSKNKKSVCNEEVLKGLRVIDLTRMLSGPYATRILADFGAEVIKIQSSVTAQGAERNDTEFFKTWNRNKRSLSLDLSHPKARDLFLELVSVSDIVVENFSPRVMTNWGLDYPKLQQVNPNLIMASISAMGQTGPWKNYVGFAPTFHALSGLLSLLSRTHEPPVNIQHPYADIVAALYSSIAILAAALNRDRTGKGRHIDISAYESLVTALGPALTEGAKGFEQDLIQDLASEQYIFWPWKEEPTRWRTAPLLGQDNRYIMMDLLGYSAAEFASFEADKILR